MGIKSFQGNQAPQKKESEQIMVSDFMTRNLITFSPNQKIVEVMQALIDNKISGAPVVNEEYELLGIISDGDCMKQISESRYYNMPIGDKTVEEFMETDVKTIDKNTSIFDCASMFYKHDYRRFPIVEN